MRSSEKAVSVVGEAGFSLLEVIIALAILMTLLISVSSLLVTSFKVGANSRYRQAATEIATSNLDYQVQVGSTKNTARQARCMATNGTFLNHTETRDEGTAAGQAEGSSCTGAGGAAVLEMVGSSCREVTMLDIPFSARGWCPRW